ncbi:Histidine kinase-, DNA gyrase B-, and HSP90-like ATPase [Variovorax sp. 770b2]|nr:Histidine kinase-, DNA gyrase B-, and HSP90-like ATPase [Variovorax sp. 770b2]
MLADIRNLSTATDCCTSELQTLAEEAIGHARATGDARLIVHALQAASSVCELAGDTAESYRLALEAEQLATAQGLRLEAGWSQIQLGKCLAVAGQLDRAIARMRTGLQLFRMLGDLRGKISALQMLARLHMDHGQYKSMLIYQQAVQHLLRPDRSTPQSSDAYVHIAEGQASYATALTAHGLHLEAKNLSLRALDLLAQYNEADVEKLTSNARFRLIDTTARLHLLQGKDALALRCASTLLRGGRRRGAVRLVAAACDRFADVRLAQGRWIQGIAWLQRARTHWAQINQHRELIKVLDKLSDAHEGFDQHAQALVHYKEARRIEERGRCEQAALRSALTAIDVKAAARNDEQEAVSHNHRLAALGHMVACIAHEVTQPLAAMRLVAENAAVDPAHAQESLSSIVTRVDQLMVYVAHLQRFSRREPVRMQAVHLSTIVEAALAIVEPKKKCCGVALSVERNAAMESIVLTDPACATGALVNLLSNAFDAVAGAREAKVVLSTRVRGERAVLSVRDHGHGLSAQAMAHLFEPFHSTKPLDKGCGLGLSLSSELTRHIGARLRGMNHPGGGALFTLDVALASEVPQHKTAVHDPICPACTSAAFDLDAYFLPVPAIMPRSATVYALAS